MFVKKAYIINLRVLFLFYFLSHTEDSKHLKSKGFFYYYSFNKTTFKAIVIACLCFAVKQGDKQAAPVFFLAA